MTVIETIKGAVIGFARIWGFCYPSRVVIFMDPETGKNRMVEKFRIDEAAKRDYKFKDEKEKGKGAEKEKSKDAIDAPKEQQSAKATEQAIAGDEGKALKETPDAPPQSQAPPQAQQQPPKEKKLKLKGRPRKSNGNGNDESELNIYDEADDRGFSMVTDLKTLENYRIAGHISTMFRGRKPSGVFPMTILSVFLPLLVITEAWQILMIYNIAIDPVISTAAGMFFLTLTIHNARYTWLSSAVQVLYATKKMEAGGAPIYVPNMIEFLNFRQSKVVDLKDDLMAMLNARIRPLVDENLRLNALVKELFDKADRARLMGQREGLTYAPSKLATVGPYWVTIIIFVIGVVLGWFLSGGMAIGTTTTAAAGG